MTVGPDSFSIQLLGVAPGKALGHKFFRMKYPALVITKPAHHEQCYS